MSDVTWLPIDGCPGYEVSSDGRVRSVRYRTLKSNGRYHTRAGKELKLQHDMCGYPVVMLYRKVRKVHRLVCEFFNGPPPSERHEVRHLNGVQTDNRAENLAWGTRSENIQDQVLHGTHQAAAKTHCKAGHLFDEENTRLIDGGRRACNECRRRRCREHYWRKRGCLMRIVEGRVEVTVRPGFAWVEAGRVDMADIPDLQAALKQAQEILWSQT